MRNTMVPCDVSIQMESDLLNTPIRSQRGLAIVPWEFRFFKSISKDHVIDVRELIKTYERVMRAHGLKPVDQKLILEYFSSYKLGYREYYKTLRWFSDIYKHYSTDLVSPICLRDKTFNWNKHGVVISTMVLDMIAIGIIIWIKSYLPGWLLLAKVSAIVILTNVAYLLVPLIQIFENVPDRVLATLFPAEYSSFYHKVFGLKILLASVTHILGHVMQIQTAITSCRTGCSRLSIYIVPKSQQQIVISYGYFAKQYPYVTGIILTLGFATMALSLLLSKYRLVRYSINQLIHQVLSFMGIALIIAHGSSQLLGFNYSYILTLPLFLSYCWQRRYKIFPIHVQINRWTITSQIVRLYLKDENLDRILSNFGNVTVYINYPKISLSEWHPFTLTRGINQSDAVLTMKRVGVWTNSLATILSNHIGTIGHINFGHFEQSKFRFYYLYDTCYFFCAGIGITAFMATMADKIRTHPGRVASMNLIWSVSDISIISDFGGQIREFQNQIPTLKIKIYYSNSRSSHLKTITQEMRHHFAYLQAVIYGISNIDIVTGTISPICCSLQRVNVIDTLSMAIVRSRKKTHIGVFICGAKQYTKNVIQSVELINCNTNGVILRAWSESS